MTDKLRVVQVGCGSKDIAVAADRVRTWARNRFVAPILLDQTGAVAAKYGVSGIPRLFIIDQGGRIVYSHSGYEGRLEHNLSAILDQMLAAPVDSPEGEPHG